MNIKQVHGLKGMKHLLEDRLVYGGHLTILADGISNEGFRNLCDFAALTLNAKPTIWSSGTGTHLPYENLASSVQSEPLSEVLFYTSEGGILKAMFYMATLPALERLGQTAFVFAALPVTAVGSPFQHGGGTGYYVRYDREDVFDPNKPNFLACYFYVDSEGIKLHRAMEEKNKILW